MDVIFLYVILLVAGVLDLKNFKIPNALSLCGTLIAFLLAGALRGWSGFGESILHVMISFIILFLIWALLKVAKTPLLGAGDMKLFVMISALLGLGGMFWVMLYAFAVSGLLLLFTRSPKSLGTMFMDAIYQLYYWVPLKHHSSLNKIGFAVPIFFGYAIYQIGFWW